MNYNQTLLSGLKNRVEFLMEKHNYTLKKVSEDTGIPVTTLSGYKKNARNPKRKNAEILSEYFNVSLPYLMGDKVGSPPINRLRDLRLQTGLTMKELSEKTGIGLSTISNYENGYSRPKRQSAEILSKFFDVSVPYILGLDNEPWFEKLTLKQLHRFEKIQHEKKQLIDRYKQLLKEELEILED